MSQTPWEKLSLELNTLLHSRKTKYIMPILDTKTTKIDKSPYLPECALYREEKDNKQHEE